MVRHARSRSRSRNRTERECAGDHLVLRVFTQESVFIHIMSLAGPRAGNAMALTGSTVYGVLESTRRFIPMPHVLFVCGGEESHPREDLRSVECYEPWDDKWKIMPEMHYRRHSHCTAIADGKLYVIGGFGRHQDGPSAAGLSNWLKTAERYDPNEQVWENLPEMSSRRGDFVAIAFGGSIYVLGGTTGYCDLSDVQRYNIKMERWDAVAPMSTPRRSFSTCVLDGKLYAVGGITGSQCRSSVESLDEPDAREWKDRASMLNARADFALVVLDGMMYAIGGMAGGPSSLDTVERYNPEKPVWESAASMRAARKCLAASALDGKIYAIGGFNILNVRRCGSGNLDSAERYDPLIDIWEDVAPMQHGRSHLGSAVSYGKIYVFGGRARGVLGDPTASAERYDPKTDIWEGLSSMHRNRFDFTVTSWSCSF